MSRAFELLKEEADPEAEFVKEECDRSSAQMISQKRIVAAPFLLLAASPPKHPGGIDESIDLSRDR